MSLVASVPNPLFQYDLSPIKIPNPLMGRHHQVFRDFQIIYPSHILLCIFDTDGRKIAFFSDQFFVIFHFISFLPPRQEGTKLKLKFDLDILT